MLTDSEMTGNDLLVLARSAPFSAKLEENLLRKGYLLRTTNSAEAAAELLLELANPILIIDCGTTPGCQEFVLEQSCIPTIVRFPVLVLGKDVEGLESRLNKIFPLATVLRAPGSPNDVLEAIRFISKHYKAHSLEEALKASEDAANPEIFEKPTDSLEDFPSEEREVEEESPVDFKENISRLSNQFAKLNLNSKHLNGETFPLYSRASYCGSQPSSFLENGPELQAIWEFESRAPAAAFRALRRVAYATAQLLSPFDISNEDRKSTIAAAYLFASGFKKHARSLLLQDYSGHGTIVLRKEIASAMKDSALDLSIQKNLSAVANIVAKLGRLIGQEEHVQDDTLSLVASAIMAADHLNRVCFSMSIWNHTMAYQLLRKIRAGKIRDLHPAITCCLLKFIAEALSGESGSKWTTPDDGTTYTPPTDLTVEERSVEVANLAPGMRLTRPLLTKDGKRLLSQEILLDQDLIMRIWQLSALRAVSPAIVKDLHEKDVH